MLLVLLDSVTVLVATMMVFLSRHSMTDLKFHFAMNGWHQRLRSTWCWQLLWDHWWWNYWCCCYWLCLLYFVPSVHMEMLGFDSCYEHLTQLFGLHHLQHHCRFHTISNCSRKWSCCFFLPVALFRHLHSPLPGLALAQVTASVPSSVSCFQSGFLHDPTSP